jgi:hypothetical protein
MHCKSYRKRTIKKRGGGPPLGLPRRDQFKQGAPQSISSKKVSNPPPLNLKPVPRSPSPIHRLPSSSSSSKKSSSKKSSSGSFQTTFQSKKKKTKGQQKVRAFYSLLREADRPLAKQRNKGLGLLSNLGVVTKGM